MNYRACTVIGMAFLILTPLVAQEEDVDQLIQELPPTYSSPFWR